MVIRALALTLATLIVAAPTHAAVLCAKKKGALAVREACRPKETQIDPVALGLVGPQGPPGPQGPAGNALSGTPHHQHLTQPTPGVYVMSTFITGSLLTDVVFFRFGELNDAICGLSDANGTITRTVVPGTGHVQLTFGTPIAVEGTIEAGCNTGTTADILLVGTAPIP